MTMKQPNCCLDNQTEIQIYNHRFYALGDKMARVKGPPPSPLVLDSAHPHLVYYSHNSLRQVPCNERLLIVSILLE